MNSHNSTYFFTPLVNFYLYSSLHIAICAAAMTWYSYEVQAVNVDIAYLCFVFCATLLLYATHRLIGIWQSPHYKEKGRFAIIAQYRWHLIGYCILSAIGSIYYFIQLDRALQWQLVLPCILSLAYALPIFGRKRRLRDFHYVKIFIIAICWAWITAAVPLYGQIPLTSLLALCLARALFILGITIPFDIRDKSIDKEVKTLTRLADDQSLKKIAVACILIALLINSNMLKTDALIAEWITGIIAAILIAYSHSDRSDDYFTGWIDATIGMSALFYVLLSVF